MIGGRASLPAIVRSAEEAAKTMTSALFPQMRLGIKIRQIVKTTWVRLEAARIPMILDFVCLSALVVFAVVEFLGYERVAWVRRMMRSEVIWNSVCVLAVLSFPCAGMVGLIALADRSRRAIMAAVLAGCLLVVGWLIAFFGLLTL
jgi:hypothetical protein